MCKKLILLISCVAVLGLVSNSKAAKFSFKVDIGLVGQQIAEGFYEISGPDGSTEEPWIVENLGGSGIDVNLMTTHWNHKTLGFRDNGFHPLFGDGLFVDNFPTEGLVVTVSGLAPGSYAFTGYHNNIWGVVGGEFDVYINGEIVIAGLRQTGINDPGGDFNDVTTSNLVFTIAEDQNSVEFMFLPPPNEPNDTVLNGFIIEEYEAGVATNPSPPDGAENIEPDVVLSWTPGTYAADVNGHNVYFGTDFNDVNDANTSSPEHKGSQDRDANSYDPTPGGGLLDLGQTYYWRIDEVNDACDPNGWRGYVWSFTVKPAEAYNPSPADGIWSVATDANLDWMAGALATSHDVYFGTDAGALSLVSPGQTSTSYDPGPLESGQAYYWRIDEHGPLGDFPGDLWSFTTVGGIVLHYKFDEAGGNTAADSSGHGLDGTVADPCWDSEGHIGGCLGFEWETLVAGPLTLFSNVGRGITVALWMNGTEPSEGDDSGTNYLFQTGFGVDQLARFIEAYVPRGDSPGDPNVRFLAGKAPNDFVQWPGGEPSDWQGEWNHYAFVKDEIEQTVRIHHNGVRVAEKADANVTTDTLALFQGRGIFIGRGRRDFHRYAGRLDDFRIYDYALSDLEISRLFRGGDLGLAWRPSPKDGAAEIPRDVVLSWGPGDYASSHDVFIGTNWDDINDVNSSNIASYPNVDYNHTDACNYVPGLLDLDQIYYWRVDEVNDTNDDTWKGNLWRFKVANYIVIDDFEEYTELGEGHDIYAGWIDGSKNSTGSYIYRQAVTPVRAEQSLKYVYDNTFDWFTGYYYSEIETTGGNLDPNNWSVFDGRTLSLWFHGKAHNDANATEQMYVGLEDSDGNYAEARYPMADMDDIRVEEWQLWEMFLSNFTNVNMAKLEKLFIGFGTRGSLVPGGGGLDHWVHFDDIRVYPPYCVPEKGPKADLSGNCIVDFADIEIMAREWLDSDVNLGEVVKPDANGLVGWWKLDEAAADTNIAHDYAGDNNGVIETLNVDVWWAAVGHDGNALEFDGGIVRVPDACELRPMHQVSASAWIYYSDEQGAARVVVKGADNKETFALEVGDNDQLSFYVGDNNDYDPCDDEYERYFAESNDDELERDEWIHVAGTFDGNTVKCYINGELKDTLDDPNAWGITLCQDTNDLGIGNRPCDMDRPFEGTIDDVRVYNYALSLKEIAHIATDGTGYLAVQSIANLYDKEALGKGAINLKDFAELAKEWLKKQLWPQ